METVNRDPIKDIRKAVSIACDQYRIVSGTHKEFIDSVVDNLPDFFRQPLQAAEPTDEDRGLKSFGESMANYQAENLRQ
jgi:hypothetical protein